MGFIGEFIVFQGSFATFPIPIILCIIASALTAVYFIIVLNRTCFGTLDNKQAYYPNFLQYKTIPALGFNPYHHISRCKTQLVTTMDRTYYRFIGR